MITPIDEAVTEFQAIELFSELLGAGNPIPGVAIASGDDTAVFSSGTWPLVTVDTLVEGVHWEPRFSHISDVGYKLLACNLSDIAAMGAEPGPFLLASSLPSPITRETVLGLAAGVADARSDHLLSDEVVLPIGGDLTRSPGPMVLTLVLFGRRREGGRVLRRKGAREGDRLWVSGPLGAAAAGLHALRSQWHHDEHLCDEILRHRRPRARCRLGSSLARVDGVHSATDISDGLAGDLVHLLTPDNLGAMIELDTLPISTGTVSVATRLNMDPVTLALGGGEDFELLVAAGREADEALIDLGMVRVGRVVVDPGIAYYGADGQEVELNVAGYEHC